MILIDKDFLTDLGIVAVNGDCGNKVSFHRDLEMTTETIKTFKRFYELATINGVNYKTEVGFYNQIGAFYGEPDIKDLVSFMNNATFDGVTPIGDFVSYYKGVCAVLDGVVTRHGGYYIDPLGTSNFGIVFDDALKFRDYFTGGAYSVRLPIRRSNIGVNQYLLTKWLAPSEKQFFILFDSANKFRLTCSTDGNNAFTRKTTSTFTDTNNADVWYCVDFTDPLCTHYIYYNGVRHDLDDIVSGTQTDFENMTQFGTAKFIIGATTVQVTPFDGMIGEAALFNFVPTQLQATDAYSGGSIKSYVDVSDDCLAAYRFVDDTYNTTTFEWTVVDDFTYENGSYTSNSYNHYLTKTMLGSIDVGLMNGQSNCSGRAVLGTLPAQYAGSTKDVSLWTQTGGNKFQYMNIGNNNQFGDTTPGSEFGMEAMLSDVQIDIERSLFTLKYSEGSSCLGNQWKPTAPVGYLYTALINHIADVNTYLNGRNIPFNWVYAIWIQGECDVVNSYDATYESSLNALISGVEVATGVSLKWVIWKVNETAPNLLPFPTQLANVAQAQLNVVNSDPTNRFLIDMDAEPLMDGVHYNATGYINGGVKTFDIIKPFIE